MELDLKKFCLLLSRAEEQAKPDVDVNLYLLDHVLTPALNGSSVLIGDIDFSQFDEADIEVLAEYYDSLFELYKDAVRLGTKMGHIPPTASKARAFC